jgi:hypothetical protein
MTQAISLGGLLIPHAKAAFGQMGDDEAVSDAKIIFQWLMDTRLVSFTQREAYRRFDSRIKKVDRLRKALGELVDRHIIAPAEKIQTKGRPTENHRVNPKIHETGQAKFGESNATSKGLKGPKATPEDPFDPFNLGSNAPKQAEVDLSEDELAGVRFYES